MLDILTSLGAATASSLWLPVLAWTVLALPLWTLLERTDRLHPLAEYRLSQVLLAALPVGTGAVSVVEMLPDAARSSVLSAQSVVVLPAIEPTSTGAPAASWTWMHAVGLFTVGALGVGLFFLGRLALEVVAARRVRRRLATVAAPSLRAEADRLRERLNVRRPVQLYTTSDAAVPLTLGGLRPMILVPDQLAEATEELRMTLRHELIHIRRWDDFAHLAERLVAALFAAHPLVGRLRRQIAEARERACDAAVLDGSQTPAGDYARLLTAFADGASPHRLGALSLSESPSSLKDRLSAMRSSMPSLLSSRRALGTALAAIGLALTLGVVACSDSVAPSASTDDPATTESSSASTEDGEVFTVVEDQPELVGGMKALQKAVSYPELAMEAGIEGRVIVQFVVDKDGTVTNPKVTRGVHKLLNEAALQAVKQQEFKPGQQQGEPVKVQMSLPVTFRLPSSHSESAAQEEILQAPKFSVAGSHPDIEGGMRALQESLSYPEIVRKAGIEGTVHVTFTVDETGEVQNPQITKSVHEALDAEALSALKSVSFVPVEKYGRPIAMEVTLPIRFALPEEK